MMRVDLPKPLKRRREIHLSYRLALTPSHDSRTSRGRSNMEKFEKGGKIFEIAQWYPRVCAYTRCAGGVAK